MPRRAALHCGPAATGWAPEAHGCDRGPRAYRPHHRIVAALDGAGAGRPNCRDNLGDIPVRGVHGDISSTSASPTDEEPRRNRGALVLLREWAGGWSLGPAASGD